MKTHSVILAAGKGSRMKSELPKVLHPLHGRPMIEYALETAALATGRRPVLVVGHGAGQVRSAVGRRARYAYQTEQKGTAHALMQAETLVRGRGDIVLVTSGDMPLLTVHALQRLLALHAEGDAPVCLLTVVSDDPRGFGRIVRAADDSVASIVEEAAASPEQLQIRELNVGAYAFADRWLWPALRRVELSASGEFYLTDLVEIAVRDGQRVHGSRVADPAETIGINTPEHLAEAEQVLAARHQLVGNTTW